MQTTQKFYIKRLKKYGIVPILKSLEFFEQREDFEECSKIINAIGEANKFREHKIPTKMSDLLMEITIQEYSKINKTITLSDVLERIEFNYENLLKDVRKRKKVQS